MHKTLVCHLLWPGPSFPSVNYKTRQHTLGLMSYHMSLSLKREIRGIMLTRLQRGSDEGVHESVSNRVETWLQKAHRSRKCRDHSPSVCNRPEMSDGENAASRCRFRLQARQNVAPNIKMLNVENHQIGLWAVAQLKPL
jgi:hypothetical protein